MAAQVQIEGMEKLQAKLKMMKRAVANRIIRKAVNSGATIVLQAAKRNVVTGPTKQLKKSLGRKARTSKKTGGYFVVIGPRRGFRMTRPNGMPYDPTFTAHLVEKGTKPHTIRVARRRNRFGQMSFLNRPQKVRHPGARAQPFLKPALDDNRAAVTGAIAAKMREGILAEASK